MRKSRFTEEQIIGILKEHEAGVRTEDVCRRHGISGTTFYKWKAKFGGLDVSEASEVRRRTRPMGTFQDKTSMDRILFAVFTHENKSQGVSTPFLLTQNN